MKVLISLLLATGIGILCRLTGIPVPAPPVIVGAILVLSMTIGYQLGNRLGLERPKRNEPLCGGPTGVSTREGR